MAYTQSTFTRALEAFIAEPSKKKRPSFLTDYVAGKKAVTADEVQKTMIGLEKHHSQKMSRRVLRPVFEAIIDYDGVITTLVSSNPMPSALVWGGLKVVLECFKRYNGLFEKVEAQLRKLTFELNRLSSYEELFSESEDMEKLIISSYIHILKFWATVEEQCLTSTFLLATKSLTSFKTRRLDDILTDIAANSNNIEKLLPIVQERLRQGERKDAANERRVAGITLDNLLDNSRKEREARRRYEVRQWIQGSHSLNDSNDRHQHKHENVLLQGTGEWIHTDERWLRWLDLTSSNNILWLNGDPGVGKSVICAYAARSIRENDSSCAVASQYFSFDEVETLSIIYRNIAEQLFHQLYPSIEEISEHVYEITQSPGNEATTSLKRLIKTFTTELTATYVFLDGFDEVHSVKERWDNTSDVVSFFADLARQPGSTLKLWCSTQQRGKIRDLMKNAESVELSASKNGDDIEIFFADALRTRNFVELDPANSAQVLSDLKQQVNGNFLWASLMLDTISDASSLKQLQNMVEEGLPEDFEKYLASRMKRIKRTHHGLLSKVLSCLVYAKRPLLLDELCEAVSISETDAGQNLCKVDGIYRGRVVDHCAPWIRVDELGGRKKSDSKTCTLSHSSIRKFLIKNPDILLRGQNCEISPSYLADVCLRYLEQKRYRKTLKRTEDNIFQTASGEDIVHHHLLGYCAKYWTRHLSDIPYSAEICERVEGFVKSKYFGTTLQIQSLLVGGQFVFRPNSTPNQGGKQLVRMFPRWFTDKYAIGTQLRRQYEAAIGEWGFFLDRISTIKGIYPGEIDRCLWGSLPKSNFLHNLQCRYKCFALESKNAEEFQGLSSLTFDNVEVGSSYLHLFRTDNFESDGTQSQLLYEKWSVGHSPRPKLIQTDRIAVTMQGLKYYRSPLRYPISGRAAEVSISNDGQIFRIGHGLFIRTKDTGYRPLNISLIGYAYMEEISCNADFIAVASRRRITEKNLDNPVIGGWQTALRRPYDVSKTSHRQNESTTTTTECENDGDSMNSGDTSSEDTESLNEEPSAAQDAEDSDGIESQFEEDEDFDQLPDDSDDFDDTDNSLESLSADESASDGSRSTPSDEVEDDGLWNDFVSDVSDANIEDEEPDTDADIADLVSSSKHGELDYNTSDDSTSEASSLDSEDLSDKISEGDMEQPRYVGVYESSSSDESTGSEEDELAANIFERLIQTERKVDPNGRVSEMSIFKIDPSTQEPKRTFHYSRSATSPIFSSPPVFHPTLDLVVWPLGGESLLFANFTENKYFTVLLGVSPHATFHISIQCYFSPCGKYLHIVSLDGHIEKGGVDEARLAPKLTMKLHISTHELSKSKPERSPPRLIYRTSVALDREIRKDQKITVPNLPYNFTWTPNYVYVTESSRLLKVIRISLFKEPDRQDTDSSGTKSVCKIAEDIYLPASADMRKVHFIPNDMTQNNSSERDVKGEVVATVILSSCNARDATRDSAGTDFHLPQVVRITTSHFGRGWEPVENRDDEMKTSKKSAKARGGRLLAKFEKFDRSQDYDIIPFLA
ncbi:hypothetical protein HD806DRAFT_378066 [Xylariaceae sp. AK1471]|nr:hypothetical protein HD806DRAFT_378066 [Xylariaceae sp. AK1471]